MKKHFILVCMVSLIVMHNGLHGMLKEKTYLELLDENNKKLDCFKKELQDVTEKLRLQSNKSSTSNENELQVLQKKKENCEIGLNEAIKERKEIYLNHYPDYSTDNYE